VSDEEKQVIHQKLFRFLNDNGHINLARELARMREMRVRADYFFKEKVVKRAFLEMPFLNDNGHINLARELARMREMRVRADYFFKEKVVKRAFLEMIEDHDAIVEILEMAKPR
jgi:translation initiation factor IF-1